MEELLSSWTGRLIILVGGSAGLIYACLFSRIGYDTPSAKEKRLLLIVANSLVLAGFVMSFCLDLSDESVVFLNIIYNFFYGVCIMLISGIIAFVAIYLLLLLTDKLLKISFGDEYDK